ncbi:MULTISPECIES: DUF305 domain-containing protein [Rhodococcus]|uniref:DUF305 domain-containing protein n=1 Tax=Rhodococcus oxybenzonivorans TaxID=1990687 RepID=A0AAE5A5C7_9NOCA|nr:MULTISPECIES: DUF305 domain-containing protein [Rhodococcus]MDV7243913.1 DUF305 domain-containing protein [Rhodococcus oxybenzonivorans]MDV7263828.1 DUF305 domain-containing protein [Rhodococcus oxybenzonivorans]MDV7274845.1 DUF305 domain-containing protein [Rhodococcus oxybenzonivorans]MDV7335084.1 DUF305 domain-containing protein [Rhodococcus oxybenzonivorans]MDV7345795.1 DUF305 domain-containing protein [Rhodococcus oxybenzonivorans]
MRSTYTAFIAAAAGAALVLAGCGTDSSDPSSSGASATSHSLSTSAEAGSGAEAFNDADVTFLRGMYPHHAQAVQMAEMVDGRTDNAELLALAQRIEAAQAPEMDQITGLLAQAGDTAPTSTGHEGMDHGPGDGMMSEDDMSTLMGMSGPEFDRMWLTMMIEHHEGAVEMADTELAEGENPDAKQLATGIVSAQQREIAEMQAMLG